MIEKTVLDYLNNKKWKAYAEKPDVPPKEYALVAKVNGSQTHFLRRAVVDIQVYSDSTYNASLLNEAMITDMSDFDDASVSECNLIGEMIYNDLSHGVYSYQTSWEIYYY